MPQPIRYPELGARLEAARARKSAQNGKYSLRRLSQEIHIDYGHVNRVFHGQSLPSREILLRICKVLKSPSQEAAEIFAATDYRAPTPEELQDVEEEQPAA